MTLLQTYRSYHFGADTELSDRQMDALIAGFLPSEPDEKGAALSGRTQARMLHLDGVGPVIIKHYHRGGFIRHFNQRTYLRLGIPRCRVEFDMLQTLQRTGVQVPEPVAYAFWGRIFYHAWLVTKVIPNALNLAAVSRDDPKRARKILPKVIRPVKRLIDIGILHVDLHPGNVMVDDHDRVFLIDFDKAKTNQLNSDRLRRRYTERWQRAVIKHGLPEDLAEGFILG